MRYLRILVPLMLIVFIQHHSLAQENPSWRSGISVDFSAGMPFYIGDFDHPWELESEFRQLPLGTRTQYNTTAFAGSVAFPLGNYLSFKLRFMQTSIYFSEDNARVFFRNTIFDTSGLLQLHVINRQLGWYLSAGGGLNSHLDADIHRSLREMETNPNFDRNYSFSTSAGTGIQYSINSMFSVFAEADWIFTGTDRIDGWNGENEDNPGAERDGQKSYFQRDQIISARGGIRFNLLSPPRRVEERAYDDLISSFVPDPGKPPRPVLPPPPSVAQEVRDERPEEYRRLDIRTSLEGITIAVEYATGYDELERKRDVAQRIANQISSSQNGLEVLLLKDNMGYTVHIGTFNSVNDARLYTGPLSNFYSGTQIRRH